MAGAANSGWWWAERDVAADGGAGSGDRHGNGLMMGLAGFSFFNFFI
jgi:hypothetical protein